MSYAEGYYASQASIDLKHGGISESWPQDSGPQARVVYRIGWQHRHLLVNELKGGYPPSATGFSSYTPPARYIPSDNLYCLSVEIEGGGSAGPLGSRWAPYRWAYVTATFGIPTFDVQTPTEAGQIDMANPILFCRQRVRASSAFKVLPDGKLKFSTSGKIVLTETAKPASQVEITLEFPKVPFNPYSICKPYLGKTNKYTMFMHAPGTLLFDSIDTDHSATTDGPDIGVALTYLGRDTDWNTLVNDAGEDELVEFDITPAPASPVRIFSQADLREMFA